MKLFVAVLVLLAVPLGAQAVDFSKDVAPILKDRCLDCHNGAERKGGLVLTTKKWAMTPSDSGEVVITSGELLHRVSSEDEDERMPAKGARLSEQEIATLRAWIDAGASWTEALETEAVHWAYVKPVRPSSPRDQSAVDYFVSKKLTEKGLARASRAENARLLRRVYLDLIGLPPPVEKVRAFESGKLSYAEVVEGLLASSRFGEHWARQWLDLARYADSNGFQADQLRDSWAFRDWVINALNQDMPFDQFSIEQLAGDLLPNAALEQKIATGFHRTVTCNVEAGVHPEANRHDQVFDRINTTGLVWMGTSLECAQCHNHKYDPFSQKEYYEMFAFFNNTPLEVDNGGKGVSFDFSGPFMELPMAPKQAEARAKLEASMSALDAEMKSAERSLKQEQKAWEVEVRDSGAAQKPYETLKITEVSSTGSELFEHKDDGSVLATGTVPSTVIYTLKAKAETGGLRALRLDAMLDPSLPGKGPGRGDPKRNNFVLNELEVYASADPAKRGQRVSILDAKADFSQGGWPVVNAVDGNRKTGWAIAPEFSKAHWGTFIFEQPIPADRPYLTVVLDQNYGRGRVLGRVKLSVTDRNPDLDELPEAVAKAIAKVEGRSKKEQKTIDAYFAKQNPGMLALTRKQEKLQRELKALKPPQTLVMVEMDKPRETHLLVRGDYLNKGMKVSTGVPEVMHAWDEELPRNRLGFARWLMSPENPLTARVVVNRWWGQLFGLGLVRTEEDFGTQCEPPTHPELLDWLAVEFVESGWSMKHMLRLMVMSDTYQQSSKFTPALLEADPENRWLARGPRFRMTAEMIRDNALAISGLLSKKMGGPPVFPPQPDNIWRQIGRNEPKYVIAKDEDRFRRGIYVIWRRAAPYPSFINFDGTDRSACAPKRSRTNTPLQALTLLNDTAYVEMARAFAKQIISEGGEDRVGYAFRRALARAPRAAERAELDAYFHEELALRKSEKEAELGAWQQVAAVLLNLDETINR